MLTNQPTELNESNNLNWSADAPRGGKAVMNRIIKENATVPLFFAQTLISSLRDVGYNHTTSALCEHVDNAIEAGATEIRVYFRQDGKRGGYSIDAAVYDNGRGMAPNVLKIVCSFGGSMNFNNRSGIGRYGMGMKTAALSISPIMELYSWQEPSAIYNMTLDVEEIGKERANLIELPEPRIVELPDELAEIFTKPMVYPKDHHEQELLAYNKADLLEHLGASGTIVYMPECDRLTYAKAQTLADHAIKEMARVYRRSISSGIKIYVNNKLLEVVDPTFSMANGRHTKIAELSAKHSQLVTGKTIQIKLSENGQQTAPVTVRLYRLPIEEWSTLSRKTLKNDLRVFDGQTVTIFRNDREVYAGSVPEIIKRHNINHWFRLQIDFPGVLDEAFGIASNKQGVRMKDYVSKTIRDAMRDDIANVSEEIRRFQGKQQSEQRAAKPSASELKATAADPFQFKSFNALTHEEESQLEANLRGLAVTLKRDGETDEEAFSRVKSSQYLIDFRHDEYWPFYHATNRFGKVILTINTAHPFYEQLYKPIQQMKLKANSADEGEENQDLATSEAEQGPTVALDLLLLSLARTQSIMSADDQHGKFLNEFCRAWSDAFRVQLTT